MTGKGKTAVMNTGKIGKPIWTNIRLAQQAIETDDSVKPALTDDWDGSIEVCDLPKKPTAVARGGIFESCERIEQWIKETGKSRWEIIDALAKYDHPAHDKLVKQAIGAGIDTIKLGVVNAARYLRNVDISSAKEKLPVFPRKCPDCNAYWNMCISDLCYFDLHYETECLTCGKYKQWRVYGDGKGKRTWGVWNTKQIDVNNQKFGNVKNQVAVREAAKAGKNRLSALESLKNAEWLIEDVMGRVDTHVEPDVFFVLNRVVVAIREATGELKR